MLSYGDNIMLVEKFV